MTQVNLGKLSSSLLLALALVVPMLPVDAMAQGRRGHDHHDNRRGDDHRQDNRRHDDDRNRQEAQRQRDRAESDRRRVEADRRRIESDRRRIFEARSREDRARAQVFAQRQRDQAWKQRQWQDQHARAERFARESRWREQQRRESAHRQSTKNTWRNLSYVGGAAGLYGLLTGNKTIAALGLGGGLYSLYRYDQDRKSQNRDARGRYELFNRSAFDHNGHHYVRRTKNQGGQKYYYFQRTR